MPIPRACLMLLVWPLVSCDAEPKQVERTPVADMAMETRPLVGIVTNGDVESGIFPWLSIGALLKPVITEAFSGEWSLMLWQRQSARDAVIMPLGPLQAARRYEASVYVKLPGNAELSPITLEWRSAVNNTETIHPLAAITPERGEWTRLAGTFDHIPSENHEGSALAITAENPAVTFFVDALDVVDLGGVDDAAVALEAQSKKNLALNGGVEAGLEGWVPQAARLEPVTEPARSGEYSMHISHRTNDWSGPTMRFASLQAGKSYRFTAYLQAATGSSPTAAQITIKTRIDGVDAFFPLAKERINENKWQRLSGIYQHKSSKGLEDIFAYIEATPSTAEFFVDDFQVEEVR